MKDSRNVILAIVLSIAVLFGWQYFVAGPAAERAQKAAQLAQQQQQAQATQAAPTQATVGSAVVPDAVNGATYKTREEAVASTQRVKIDTPSLTGSINLTGGRLDDLSLKKFHVDVSDQSPIITLLTPATAPDAYFVEQGWVTSGGGLKLPDAQSVWTVDGGTGALTPTTPVTLSWDNGQGLVFHRKFAVDSDYLFTVTQSVDNKTSAPVTLFPYSQVTRHGTPAIDNVNGWILHEGAVGFLTDKNLVDFKYQDLQKDQQQDINSNGGWLGFTDKYFSATVIPDPGKAIAARFSYTNPQGTDVYKAAFVDKNAITVAPGQTATDNNYVFAGAKVESVISAYQAQYHFDHFDFMIDWGWLSFLTHPIIFKLIQFFHSVTGNFGVAILCITVLMKLILFPLANRSYASMAAMRNVQPQVKALQEKYKDDRAALQQATMELYKKEKINPLAGCLPLLIQIPIFYSLYTVLYITIEMRHAPFFGWIQDLAAPDPTNIFTLFGLIPWHPEMVPVFGHFLNIGVWPLLMGFTMWLQMRLNPPPPDPTQAAIFQIMPIIFTFTLGTFPAGLVIYWAWNNTLSIIQQYVIMKRHGAKVDLLGNTAASFRRTPGADKAGG
ncbi:MAG TPA: membrane protein insertase YidC [Devosiaceae bacterium]|nr:membrane protein insertase YidC [Devosiaceae bacterium]